MSTKDTHHPINPEKVKASPFVIFVASVAAIAGILFGFDTGVISGAILFIKTEFHLSSAMNGMVVSAVLLGAVIGASLGGRFADQFGRRNILIVTALIYLVGITGSASSLNVTMLIVCRIIEGIAIGMASFVSPLYISEISPPKWRGLLVSLTQLMVTLGILSAYLVDAFFAYSANWRAMFAVGIVPGTCLLIGMLFLPKSPRWLLVKGREFEAKKVLQRIRQSRTITAELTEIKSSIVDRSSWRMLLQKWLWPAMAVGIGLAFFQQFTGINTIIYYAPTIFQMAGFKSASIAIMATIGVGVVNVLMTLVALPLLDRVGRKPLLLVGITCMLASLIGLSVAFHISAQHELLKWIALAGMIVFIAGFAVGLGPVMWLMFSEIFPLEIRGLATSVAAAVMWGFNGIVSLTFLLVVDGIGASRTFLLYALLCLAGLWFVIKRVPETKGVSLEQIEKNLREGRPSRELGCAE